MLLTLHTKCVACPAGLSCSKDVCMSSSSGTAGLAERNDCACQCLPHLPVFREDLHICIDDIQGKIILSLNESVYCSSRACIHTHTHTHTHTHIYHHYGKEGMVLVLTRLQAGRFMVLLPAGTVFGAHKTSCTVGITGKVTGE
jgi:hypothetical protein